MVPKVEVVEPIVQYSGWLAHLYNFQQLAAGILAILAALSAIIAVVVDHRIRANRERLKSLNAASNFLASLKYRMDRSIEELEAIENLVEAVQDSEDVVIQLGILRSLKPFPEPKELFQLEDRDFGLGASFSQLCFEYRDTLLQLNGAISDISKIRTPMVAVPKTQNQLQLDNLLAGDIQIFRKDLLERISEIEAQHAGCVELAEEIQKRIADALEDVNTQPLINV